MKRLMTVLLCAVLLLMPVWASAEYESDSELADSFMESKKKQREEEDEEYEGIEIPELTLTPSFDGKRVTLGNTGMALMIPQNWEEIDLPEGAICAYGDHKSVTLTVYEKKGRVEKFYEDLSERSAKENEKSTDGEPDPEQAPEVAPESVCQLLRLNDRLFVNYTDTEGNDNAYTMLDPDHVLHMVFAYAGNTTAQSSLPAEIIASIDLAIF